MAIPGVGDDPVAVKEEGDDDMLSEVEHSDGSDEGSLSDGAAFTQSTRATVKNKILKLGKPRRSTSSSRIALRALQIRINGTSCRSFIDANTPNSICHISSSAGEGHAKPMDQQTVSSAMSAGERFDRR